MTVAVVYIVSLGALGGNGKVHVATNALPDQGIAKIRVLQVKACVQDGDTWWMRDGGLGIDELVVDLEELFLPAIKTLAT